MSRNRMKNGQSMHWMSVVKWVLIAAMLAVLGLCYMKYKNQNIHLAQEIYNAQKQLDGIEARNEELAGYLGNMKGLTLLDKRLKQMHSTLVQWGDPRASWVRLDQNTRARLARIGTPPKTMMNLDAVGVAATAPPARQQSSH